MDNTINPVSGASQLYITPAVKGSTNGNSTPQPASDDTGQTAETAGITSQQTSSAASRESEYETALRQAALSFKNVYAVSDQSFSIFKDASGKYITRYVSLRDGKVTYVPEITLLKQLQMSGGTSLPRVTISA